MSAKRLGIIMNGTRWKTRGRGIAGAMPAPSRRVARFEGART